MKVAFKTTPEDFADVAKRSSSNASAAIWRGILIYTFIFGGICGVIGHLVFGHWAGALGGFLLGATIMVGITWSSSTASLARYYENRYKTNWPIENEVEISSVGLSCKQLDHKINFDWTSVQCMEETDDAIYFRTEFDHVLCVRRRGFASQDQQNEFLKMAYEMMVSVRPEETIVK